MCDPNLMAALPVVTGTFHSKPQCHDDAAGSQDPQSEWDALIGKYYCLYISAAIKRSLIKDLFTLAVYIHKHHIKCQTHTCWPRVEEDYNTLQ